MTRRIGIRLSYLAVLVAAIALGSVVAAQTWAVGAPDAAESGDAGRSADSPLPLESPFDSAGEAEVIHLEHLPDEVQTLGPSRVVLEQNGVRLCGAGFGPFSVGRRYCDSEGNSAFTMNVGISPEQSEALDPTLEINVGPVPKGVEVFKLADGSDAFFSDESAAGDEEATGSLGSGPVVRLVRLAWIRVGDGMPVALTATIGAHPSAAALDREALIEIANSIDLGRPLVGIPVPNPREIGKRAQSDLPALIAELRGAGLEVDVQQSSEPGLIVNVGHELIVFGEQMWAIPGSTIRIELGG